MKKAGLKEYAQKIYAFYGEEKRMPSYAEMLALFRLRSKNAVFKRVSRLAQEGLISRDERGRMLPRALAKPIKLLGFIRAGFPSPAEEETVDLMSLDEYLISNPQATYLLKVDGDSMIGAGILPGDLVLIQRNLTPRNGDIVVACVDGAWTLKYFEKIHTRVRLRAANRKYPPLEPKEELTVAGVVIANVRKYK